MIFLWFSYVFPIHSSMICPAWPRPTAADSSSSSRSTGASGMQPMQVGLLLLSVLLLGFFSTLIAKTSYNIS